MHNKLPTETVFRDEYLQIYFREKQGYIGTEWMRHPSSEVFRKYTLMAANLMMEHSCQYWLSDARKIYYLELADQNWILQKIIPRINPTIRKFARVTSDEGIMMLDMVRISDKVKDMQQKAEVTIQVETFVSKEDAIDWLLQEEAD